jgi:tRNA-splicing ligase RtcB
MVVRTYEEEMEYLEKLNDYSWRIKKGFVPNMKARRITLILKLKI